VKYYLIIMVIFTLGGCDLDIHFNNEKIKVISLTCEVSSISNFTKKSGEEKFNKPEIKTDEDNKSILKKLYFSLTEMRAATFSKIRDGGEIYYELRKISNNKFSEGLTINVWPSSSHGFTSVNKIDHGYYASTIKDGKKLRENIETINVSDALLNAQMWDTYTDIDTFAAVASTPISAENVRKVFQDASFPLMQFDKFSLNRISGDFLFVESRYFGEQSKPDTRQAEVTEYRGQCHGGLAI